MIGRVRVPLAMILAPWVMKRALMVLGSPAGQALDHSARLDGQHGIGEHIDLAIENILVGGIPRLRGSQIAVDLNGVGQCSRRHQKP